MTRPLLVAIAAVSLASATACSRISDAATEFASTDTVDVFSIHVGDCLRDPAQGEETVTDMKKVDCAKPHDYEVYHTFKLAAGAFPGDDTVDKASESGCTSAFQGFVGKSYDESKLDMKYLTPQAEGWKTQDDREVVCMIAGADESPLTGTMRGANS